MDDAPRSAPRFKSDRPVRTLEDRRLCSGCGAVAPNTESNYTLISAKHGWRLELKKLPNGRRETIWRCAKCWEAHKGRHTG